MKCEMILAVDPDTGHETTCDGVAIASNGFLACAHCVARMVNEDDDLARDFLPIFREVKVGVAIMVFHDGKLLFGKRKGSHGAGSWSLPGGHVDFGEEPVNTARRELLEETGLKVGEILPWRTMPWVNTHFPKDGKQYITLYFAAQYLGGEPKVMEPNKCDGWGWFDPKDPPYPLFEPLRQEWYESLRQLTSVMGS